MKPSTFRQVFLFALLGLIIPLTSIFAASFKAADCHITFQAKGQPVVFSIEGSSAAPCEGKLQTDPVSATVLTMDLSNLETGIPLRNKHLRENYLQVSKYPKAIFTLKSVENLPQQLAGQAGENFSLFQGEMELHGQKKLISDGKYRIKDGRLTATFSFYFPDFGMEQPNIMGMEVVDRVNVSVEMRFDAL
jgi:polyisoprenoid-binding protein YceI